MIKRISRFAKLAVAFSLLLGVTAVQAKDDYSSYFKNLPFDMKTVKAPVFKKNTVLLTQAGGVGDGETMNTEAFKKAIDMLVAKGGGKLVVPAGVWYTGPIILKSNINLHLEKGALILFNPDFNLYPIIETSFEGLDTKRCISPVYGKGLVNVAITGEGSINGSGHVWRPVKREKVTDKHWKSLLKSGGVLKNPNYWFPSESSLKGDAIANMNVPVGLKTDSEWNEVRDFLRPAMVSLVECKNVLLQGVLFDNSPSWNVHPLMCENVIVDGVFIRNPGYSQNGDGIDLESCKNSIIVNSTFDVGDDAICIKSGKDEDGRRRAMPTENLIVDNCKVFQGHGGFVVGSEMSGGVKNVVVRNCQFLGTDVGLRFKSTRGRGGVVENIYINDIYMFDIATDSFLFDLYYGGKSASESMDDGDVTPVDKVVPAVDEKTPAFRNIYVKNIVSRHANRAMYFNGLPEMNITNINVENGFFTCRNGAELRESDGIKFKNITVIPDQGAALKLYNIKNFDLKEFNFPKDINEAVNVSGTNQNIHLPASIDQSKISGL